MVTQLSAKVKQISGFDAKKYTLTSQANILFLNNNNLKHYVIAQRFKQKSVEALALIHL